MHFNISPSTLMSSKWFLSFKFCHQSLSAFPSAPYVSDARPISISLIWPPEQCWMTSTKTTNRFIRQPSPDTCYFFPLRPKISPSTPCSLTDSARVFPLILETKFNARVKQQSTFFFLVLCVAMFIFVRSTMEDKQFCY
jgi:hypothetical protein